MGWPLTEISARLLSQENSVGKLASFFVVIAGQRKDLLAANLPTVLQDPRLASDTEIPEEVEDVIGLHGGVQAFEDRLIHLLDTSKRAIAVADYVVMPEMKICGEPRRPYLREYGVQFANGGCPPARPHALAKSRVSIRLPTRPS
jgi:hypothetical protein